MSAQDLQIASLRPWIRKLALKWQRCYGQRTKLDLDDLCQVGALWALKAVPGWDPALGSWITYATPWIEEGMRQECEGLLLKGVGKRGHYRRTREIPVFTAMAEELPVPPQVNEQRVWLERMVRAAGLSDRELLIIERCELREETYESVGAELGVTRERVRQVRERALEKLREVVL